MVKLKKSLVLILSLALVTLFMNCPLVLAEGTESAATTVNSPGTDLAAGTDPAAGTPVVDENGNPVDAGILPNSPFYWWDQLWSKVQLALAWTPEQEAVVLHEQSLEYLAEAAELTKEEQTGDAEIALDGYMAKVDSVESLIETLADPSSTESQDLLKAITARNASNIQVLGNLIMSEKLPPQAAERIFINAVKKITKCMAKLDHQTQIEMKKELRNTTEEVGNVEPGLETELALTESDTVGEDVSGDQATDVSEEETLTDPTIQEDNGGQDLNKGQAKKVQRQETGSDPDVTVSDSADTGADEGTDTEVPNNETQNNDKNKGNGNGKGSGNGKH